MMTDSIDPETLDFIWEVTRGGPPNQYRDIDSLDAKVTQVFSAASVVIGLAVVATAKQSDVVTSFLVAAITAYALAAGAALWSLWIREVHRPYHSDTLLDDFWARSTDQIKYALADELPKIYAANQALIRTKAVAGKLAMFATTVEVIAVGLMLVWSRLV